MPKPVILDANDFDIAYFLFSLSVFGVAKITNGRAIAERTKLVDATKRVPFSSANLNVFFKALFVYILLKFCLFDFCELNQ